MGSMKLAPSCLQGTVHIPPSKSQAHRAILCAAMAKGESIIEPVAASKDMEATLRVVQSLGVAVRRDGARLTIDGSKLFSAHSALIDCGESGSTLRFAIPIAAVGGMDTTFIGQGLLPQRPLGAYLDLLPRHGVPCASKGGLPLQIEGQLTPGVFSLPGNVSSQYITGLLLALPLLEGDSEIVLTTPLESAGYVDMTLDVMASFGVTAEKTAAGYRVPGKQTYCAHSYQVEGDWSQAAFFLTAGALNGAVTLTGLHENSLQGDQAIVSVLKQMGARIEETQAGIFVQKCILHAIETDVSQIPDLVPVLAVACAFAKGRSVIRGGERLRFKESDRIASTLAGLRAIGVPVTETADGMVIEGGAALHGGSIHGYNDHRIVMAFAVAALCLPDEVIISDRESIAKSYPEFFTHYQQLGGVADVVSLGE